RHRRRRDEEARQRRARRDEQAHRFERLAPQAARPRRRGQRQGEDQRHAPAGQRSAQAVPGPGTREVFTNMKRVGGRPTVDYCLAYAQNKANSEKSRTNALAALENRIDKNNPGDTTIIVDILTDDANPDPVRAVAMARLGELPKEMILPKLYALFDKKWKVRLDAARMVLRTITTKDLPDFLQHLPQNDKTKLALSEPIAYGSLIMQMDPQGGPKPRDVLAKYLQG